ncbi:TPA: MTH1187 family thiamine-binding protein [Candidatus Micrarchaeota archaeon]|nr:MTH1187 family thiamine-binding protein [Candidatus Micrarchaeota archaeon]
MIVEFSISPIGAGESLSRYVAKVIDLVDKSGLPYLLTPMGTIVEGEWDEVMELIKRCHHLMREMAPRVATRIYIDDRPGRKGLLEYKTKSVEEKVGRPIRRAKVEAG